MWRGEACPTPPPPAGWGMCRDTRSCGPCCMHHPLRVGALESALCLLGLLQVLGEVLDILAPVKDLSWPSGRWMAGAS